jgi:uncharacterized protein GlcG (DUF336 family)
MIKNRLKVMLGAMLFAPLLMASSVSFSSANEALVNFKVLSPETAMTAAKAALENCRSNGYQVSVAIVDRFGVSQVLLRDRFAGAHTPSTAFRKAWTAVSFRSDTVELSGLTQAGGEFSGIRHIDGALMVGGGVPIEAAGSIVGGIGISGAPSGKFDDACARAGIESIEEEIAF